MRSLLVSIFFLGLSQTLSGASLFGKKPKVLTRSGLVTGIYEKSYHGRPYAAYKGIPYAEPPTGSKRFEV